MKSLIYFSIIMFVIACNQRKDVFLIKNSSPKISFNQGFNQESKTITDSSKLGFYYDFQVNINDSNEMNVHLEISSNLLYESYIDLGNGFEKINENKITVKKGIYYLRYFPLEVGNHYVKVIGHDNYNLTDLSQLNLIVFNNLLPVAILEVSNSTSGLQNERILSGTSSFDRDREYGGEISSYHFEIYNGNSLLYSQINGLATRLYNFNPGTFLVKLKVKDNNNIWSQESTKTITIQ